MRNLPFDPNREPRPICYACLRPASHCLCAEIQPFAAHCNFLILQHPHERKKYHSTARLLRSVVTNVSLLRGISFEEQSIARSAQAKTTYLLYPGRESIDAADVPLDLNSTIIVVDGTWIEARKILHRNPFLKQLQRISFKAPLRSKFIIRKQPKDNYLSTIESVAHLLQINALAYGRPAQAERYQALFDLFLKLVERQFAYFPRNARGGSGRTVDV